MNGFGLFLYSGPIWIWLRYCVSVGEREKNVYCIKVLGEERRYLYYFQPNDIRWYVYRTQSICIEWGAKRKEGDHVNAVRYCFNLESLDV